jgi:hypothetical protein
MSCSFKSVQYLTNDAIMHAPALYNGFGRVVTKYPKCFLLVLSLTSLLSTGDIIGRVCFESRA